MITKRAKHVRLDQQMIDTIWDSYNTIKGKTKSKDAACKRIATFIGCSASTVYRVICACEDAEAGAVLTYDPNKYPNAMMVEHINRKFAQAADPVQEVEEVTSTKSDIQLLAESIQALAAAITALNTK